MALRLIEMVLQEKDGEDVRALLKRVQGARTPADPVGGRGSAGPHLTGRGTERGGAGFVGETLHW